MSARLWTVGAITVVCVAWTATAPSAAGRKAGRCISEVARSGLISQEMNPSNANFIAGTDGNDTFAEEQFTDGVDIVCGFGGDDDVDTLSAGDVFYGGEGRDAARHLDGGTFDGGAGDDFVFQITGGTFNGGAGRDVVIDMYRGTFNGGLGDDNVQTISGGTFNGGAGADSVVLMFAATFNGGAGDDFVYTMAGGTFNGGAGDDAVREPAGGTFNQD